MMEVMQHRDVKLGSVSVMEAVQTPRSRDIHINTDPLCNSNHSIRSTRPRHKEWIPSSLGTFCLIPPICLLNEQCPNALFHRQNRIEGLRNRSMILPVSLSDIFIIRSASMTGYWLETNLLLHRGCLTIYRVIMVIHWTAKQHHHHQNSQCHLLI